MASVLYVLHLTVPVDMYFISVSAIKALFVLLLILITFWMKTLSSAHQLQNSRCTQKWIICLRKRHQESLHRPM